MARLNCKCGQLLSNSNNPEIEFKVFSDDEWIELLNRAEEGEKVINLSVDKTHYWKCSKCGRLYFFKNEVDEPIAIYKLEELGI